MKAKAIYACIAENPGEITFDAGDILTGVHPSNEEGWFEGSVSGQRGLFPVVYAELMPEIGDDINILTRLQQDGLLSSTLQLEAFRQEAGLARAAAPALPAKPALAPKPVLAPKPTLAPKPALSPRPTPSPKPTLAPKPVIATKPLFDGKPAVAPKPQTLNTSPQPAPPLPHKPLIYDTSDPVDRHQKERDAAADWEARHLGHKPSVASKPVFLTNKSPNGSKPILPQKPAQLASNIGQTTNPANENDAPSLPYDVRRRPIPAPQKPVVQKMNPAAENDAPALPFDAKRRPVPPPKKLVVQRTSPAVENDAPALPYHPSRQVAKEPVKPVEDSIQPHPANLISKFSGAGFEDNFDPKAHIQKQQQQPSQQQQPAPVMRGMSAAQSMIVLPAAAAPAPAPAPAALYQPPPTTAVGSGSIPLTAAKEVKGTGFPKRRPVPGVPPKTTSLRSVPPTPPTGSRANSMYSNTSAAPSDTSSMYSSTVMPQPPPKPDAALRAMSMRSLQQTTPGLTRATTVVHQQAPRAATIQYSTYSVANNTIPSDALVRYGHLFKRLDKQGKRLGYLTSDQVQAVIGRSRLSDDQLRQIWALADRNLDGRFGPGEFFIAMHLVDSALRNDPIPETLSVNLLNSAYAK
ncbi:actin organization and endocytosis protein [Linderina macrospora]|uniref:Actin organization and endocytosis protein n=1 Tax=Linderina macrospora TaxID=4868 RepID=A0ACC1JFH1_9FUNG|nr:actin organization and endocytosis protein [Linderina macrospora]